LHWLLNGAEPTETVAILLKREGVLDEFFAQRPKAKRKYSFLDKRTETMTVESAVSQAAEAETATEAAAEEPVVEAAAEEAPAEVVAEEATEEPKGDA
jgi:small subunit ribosomal protein S16